MKLSPKISVIVPVYNVESYLNRCVDSILNQTISDFELILVDDGSPDNCGKMCDEWAQKDKRIKVIHKQNGGLSEARNYGVLISSASYITFVDSDDYLNSDYLSYLYCLITAYKADISMCYFIQTDEDSLFDKLPNDSNDTIECIDSIESCLRFCKYQQYGVSVCKLYKKDLLIENPFPTKRFYEDTATIGKVLYASKKTVVGQKQLYAYFQNTNGITRSIPTEKKRIDQLWAVTENAKFFDEKNEKKIARYAWDLLPRVLILNSNLGGMDKYILNAYYKEYKAHVTFSLKYLKVFFAVKLNFLFMLSKKIKGFLRKIINKK